MEEVTEEPAELVGRIAPTPLVIVHGRDDHFFDEEQAWLLYGRAGQPKRLLLARRFGHAEDGYSVGFGGRVASKSSLREPTPRPSTSRPPESWSTLAASLASNTGLRVGPSRMLVTSPTRSVTAAAAAKVISDS